MATPTPTYTTVKKVVALMGLQQDLRDIELGTGDGTTASFNFVFDEDAANAGVIVAQYTERVYVAGALKVRDHDYTMDYDYGIVTFTAGHIPASPDKVTASFWAIPISNESITDTIMQAQEFVDRTTGHSYYASQAAFENVDGRTSNDLPFQFYSKSTFNTNAEAYRDTHNSYLFNRVFFLSNRPALTVDGIILKGTQVLSETVSGSALAYTLANTGVAYYSETVTVGGVKKTRGTDYTINYATGAITFTVAPGASAVVASYWYGTSVALSDAHFDLSIGRICLSTDIITHGLQTVQVSYTYGCEAVPYNVQRVTEWVAVQDMMKQSFFGTPVALDVSRMNLSTVQAQIDRLFNAIGRRLEVGFI